MEVAYGWTVKDDNDQLISLIQEAFRITATVLRPGVFPVEYFPLLRFIPSWMPGGKFRKQAAVWKKQMSDVEDIPHEWVKSQMVSPVSYYICDGTSDLYCPQESGNYLESFTSKMLLPEDGVPPTAEEEDHIKFCAEALHAGGADTVSVLLTVFVLVKITDSRHLQTVSAMTAFFLLMSKFPSVQQRAQAEISRIIGNERLPNWGDQDNLPYVRALIQEILRWATVAPLGTVILIHIFNICFSKVYLV